MRKNDSLLYLRHQFRMVEERIHKAQRRLHESDMVDRVHAAGEMARLEDRRATVARKIARVAADKDNVWTSLKDEILIDLDAISVAVDEMVHRH